MWFFLLYWIFFCFSPFRRKTRSWIVSDSTPPVAPSSTRRRRQRHRWSIRRRRHHRQFSLRRFRQRDDYVRHLGRGGGNGGVGGHVNGVLNDELSRWWRKWRRNPGAEKVSNELGLTFDRKNYVDMYGKDGKRKDLKWWHVFCIFLPSFFCENSFTHHAYSWLFLTDSYFL